MVGARSTARGDRT